MFTGVLQALLLAAWAASLVFCAMSAYFLASFYRRGVPSDVAGGLPPMSVMKPIKGADEDTYENLKSFILQDYPEYQVVFGVADARDPAADIIRRLIKEHPEVDAMLVITGEPVGPNYKVSNLHYMEPHARHNILVIADGDMRVDRGYLSAVASGFSTPDVGVVTCPYRGVHPGDAGAALEALSINSDFLPSVMLAERLEGMSFALGATMAVRREALDAIGGFRALAGFLADDYQLGNLVAKAGYRVVLSGYVVDSMTRSESVGGWFAHQLRWGRTYRVSRPGGYFMSVLTRGTALSLMFLLASGFSAAGWWVVAANLAIRYAQFFIMETGYVKSPGVAGYFWLLPFRDVASFVIWFLSFSGNTVSWKDARFRIDKSGRMVRV